MNSSKHGPRYLYIFVYQDFYPRMPEAKKILMQYDIADISSQFFQKNEKLIAI